MLMGKWHRLRRAGAQIQSLALGMTGRQSRCVVGRVAVSALTLTACLVYARSQVENMFYNVPARLSALRSSSEEYARILDVVTKYAVHNAGVSFLCKKVARATPVDVPNGSASLTSC